MAGPRRKSIVVGGGLGILAVTAMAATLLLIGRGSHHVVANFQAPIPSGIYVDGVQGTPHYFISLTVTGTAGVSGTVAFLHQDGQTSAAFSFTGTMQSGLATLTTSTGQLITATYSVTNSGQSPGLTLGICDRYLQYASSLADCNFAYSPSGAF